jgi:raffinose/stachyose/melibiose transport system substrate-binding protein
MAAVACGGTPGQSKPTATAGSQAPVKTDGFDKLGPITLRVVSANGPGGPRDAENKLIKQFEAKYPNVTVKVSYRDYSSWIKQIKLTMSTDNPPDVVEGAQGYLVDGALVKAGLIIPLDKYAKAYGWDKDYTPETLQQLEWSSDGHTFGEGQLWGIAQSGQSVGVFANLAKLKAAGVDPAGLKTFGDFEAALKKLRASLPASEPVIMLGNKEQYESVHAWGMIQGAYTPAQSMRDWVFHKSGATFDSPTNLESLEHLKAWAQANYFGKADDYNGRGEADASTGFARGKGAFFLGGNWNASTIKDGLKGNAAFFDMPPGDSGKYAAIGSVSLPMHISVKSKYPDVAAALIQALAGPQAAQALLDTAQVPAVPDTEAKPTDPFAQQVVTGWDRLVTDGGLTLFPDWASPTMLQTMGQAFQEMMIGKISPKDAMDRLQKDWADYDQELGGG